jgi:hypothetical protein
MLPLRHVALGCMPSIQWCALAVLRVGVLWWWLLSEQFTQRLALENLLAYLGRCFDGALPPPAMQRYKLEEQVRMRAHVHRHCSLPPWLWPHGS